MVSQISSMQNMFGKELDLKWTIMDSSEELVYWALAANIPGREMSTREEYGIVFGTAARRTSHLARIKHVLQVSWIGMVIRGEAIKVGLYLGYAIPSTWLRGRYHATYSPTFDRYCGPFTTPPLPPLMFMRVRFKPLLHYARNLMMRCLIKIENLQICLNVTNLGEDDEEEEEDPDWEPPEEQED